MFKGMLTHPRTQKSLQAFISSPSHALLLVGPKGSGKSSLAKQVAAQLLNLDVGALESYPHYSYYQKPEDKKDISIDTIREVNKLLSLKTPGTNKVRRVIVVDGAHHMNQAAQNAFLKSLEEPADDTVFILTANAKTGLLPTVVSRTQVIIVHKVGLDAAKAFFTDSPEIEAAWRLSQGTPGLLASLMTAEPSELKKATESAKSLLKMSRFDRIVELGKISKNKQEFSLLLEGLARIIKALYVSSAANNKASQTKRLLGAMRLVLETQEAIDKNVLPRLAALRLGHSLNV